MSKKSFKEKIYNNKHTYLNISLPITREVGVKSSLFLSYLINLDEHFRNYAKKNNIRYTQNFYRTSNQIQVDLGMSGAEQRSSIDKLSERAFITTETKFISHIKLNCRTFYINYREILSFLDNIERKTSLGCNEEVLIGVPTTGTGGDSANPS